MAPRMLGLQGRAVEQAASCPAADSLGIPEPRLHLRPCFLSCKTRVIMSPSLRTCEIRTHKCFVKCPGNSLGSGKRLPGITAPGFTPSLVQRSFAVRLWARPSPPLSLFSHWPNEDVMAPPLTGWLREAQCYHQVPSTLLQPFSNGHLLSSPQKPYREGTVTIPLVQKRKLRLRWVKQLPGLFTATPAPHLMPGAQAANA